ncbi:zinc-dependent alcohol dehydrogenase [Heliomarina baculiformis]|uniref:zinc-dependent alcohol dehydrogenase n=1 Tax=Heliomarina baculiformis TaxID=2872036 RepID=UPI00308040A3
MNVPLTTRSLILAHPLAQAVKLVDRPLASPGPDEALLRISCAGICGTDLHIIGWNSWAAKRYRTPLPLGHELCAEIVEIAPGLGFAPGDRVSAETHLGCASCAQCLQGRGHTCEVLKTFTSLGLGAFGDYATVPVALLRRAPTGIQDEQVASMEPAGIGLRAARRALRYGNNVTVSGCGPIGLLTILALRHLGATRVLAIEPSEIRRSLALACGAHDAIAPNTKTDTSTARQTDAVIETSGAPAALASALAMPCAGGGVVTVGLPAADVPVDVAGQIVLREIRLEGVYGRLLDEGWTDLQEALTKGLDLAPAITHSYSLENYREALDTAARSASGKVILRM